MLEPEDQKELRRKKISESHTKKEKISEEERFRSKVKKRLKKEIEDMRADELWEDWEDEIR
jgi:hypothetical protein